jgi:hypothetical protein
MGIFGGLKRARARMITASTVAMILAPHDAEYWAIPRLAGHSEEWKKKYKDDFANRTLAVMQAEDPLLALRDEIGNWAVNYANYKVLVMTPDLLRESFYADCPYISAELCHHLDALTEHHDTLREFWWTVKDDQKVLQGSLQSEAVFNYATTSWMVALYYLNGFNLMRAAYDDFSKAGRDWFRPMVLSALIAAEDNYRNKIGLPSLTDGRSVLRHVAFPNIVARGEKNPLWFWEDTVKEPHPYQQPA